MKKFSLYRLGRFEWFHITTFSFKTFEDAKNYYTKEFTGCMIDKNKIGSYKIIEE
jgi:hypothetical protein